MMGEESQDLVPDSLLAFAKDHRYIRQCRDLLQGVFQQDDSENADLWWWSALVYGTLVVGRKGRTLGMQFVGLEHAKLSPWQRRMGLAALTAGWALSLRQCMMLERSQQEEQRHEALRGAARLHFHQQQRRAMLQRASRTTAAESSSVESSNTTPRRASDEQTLGDVTKRMQKLMKRFIEVGYVFTRLQYPSTSACLTIRSCDFRSCPRRLRQLGTIPILYQTQLLFLPSADGSYDCTWLITV
jgi:hypothetical protein